MESIELRIGLCKGQFIQGDRRRRLFCIGVGARGVGCSGAALGRDPLVFVAFRGTGYPEVYLLSSIVILAGGGEGSRGAPQLRGLDVFARRNVMATVSPGERWRSGASRGLEGAVLNILCTETMQKDNYIVMNMGVLLQFVR